jgi:hypothetical protein
MFFVEHFIFIESYYVGCLLLTEARPFCPMMVKIIPRLFINTIFNCSLTIKYTDNAENTLKQAGLSRATLEIYSEFSSNLPLRSHMSYILRSFWFQAFLVWSPELKFKIWGRSDQWLLIYSAFNIWGHPQWRSSSF